MSAIHTSRKAGILLHITSLPGNYEVGDFGPEAYKFADFLKKAGQAYWQILPLNQLDSNMAYSPYSPLSAFAGNTMFINPEILIQQNLLKKNDYPGSLVNSDKVKYSFAQQIKDQILERAYDEYTKSDKTELKRE